LRNVAGLRCSAGRAEQAGSVRIHHESELRMTIRVTLLLLVAIIVGVTVFASLVIVPGPVNERMQLLMPIRR
jgi:uncharacterized BrkB/YihY/UPF0761 family membrane protein